MSRRPLGVALCLALAMPAAGALAQPVNAPQPGNTDMMDAPPTVAANKGPTSDVLAHDPVIQRQGDTWYLFTTGPGVSVWSSKDLKKWVQQAPVFARSPAWTEQVVPGFNGHIWAPEIAFHDGVYTLYYSVSAGGKNTSAIGVATNTTLDPADPAFKWVDHGTLLRSVPQRDLWNAIDGNPIDDVDGTPWLSFGSFWGGLKLVKLGADRRSLAEPQEWHTIAKRERSILVDDAEPEPAALEAPHIVRHDGWFYLYLSWDHCCRGIKSDYRVMVGRSRSLQGPYLDRDGKRLDQGGGTEVLRGNSRWIGPGHNSVLSDGGKEYLVFHAYDPKDDGLPKLQLLPLSYDGEGWPKAAFK